MFLELLVALYPLYETVNYITFRISPSKNKDSDISKSLKAFEKINFLATWWSAFGIFTISENLLAIDHIPLYGITKSGILIALYFDTYQSIILEKTSEGIEYVQTKISETEVFNDVKTKLLNVFGSTIINNYPYHPATYADAATHPGAAGVFGANTVVPLGVPLVPVPSGAPPVPSAPPLDDNSYINNILRRIRG